jgi:hypothetical protein
LQVLGYRESRDQVTLAYPFELRVTNPCKSAVTNEFDNLPGDDGSVTYDLADLYDLPNKEQYFPLADEDAEILGGWEFITGPFGQEDQCGLWSYEIKLID